jgi:hypothetical protein
MLTFTKKAYSLEIVSMVGGVMGLGPDTVRDGAGEDLPLPFVGDLASLPFPLPIAFC